VRDHPYPQGRRWDDAIAKLAEMDVEDGHPLVAIARLERMLERYENTTIIGSYTQSGMPMAQLNIARIYRDELRDYDEADSQFRRVVRRFPDSILHDDASYERGAMWLDQGERERGCDILRDVVEDFEVGHPRRLAAARVEADCGGSE
jgi:tetratricopeptide (TPR) repeat protein